jgi:hypothetical protein
MAKRPPTKFKITDTDLGWKRLMKSFGDTSKVNVQVGVFPSAGKHAGDSTLTMTKLASIHEYGAPSRNIPERSFMRATFSEKASAIEAKVIKLAKKLVKDGSGKEKAMGLLGEYIKGLMQARIRKGIPPPNKPATVAKKGSSTPLIDTGQLINSIEWKVASKK